MDKLKVALFQIDINWEKKDENLKKISKIFKKINNDIDLIILPEMFTTGFTMNTLENAEDMNGITINWMKQYSKETNSLIIGSIIINENKKYYNRLICSFPDGNMNYYDKKHLFRMSNENKHYTSGNKKLIIEFKGWNMCPMICYDLRFPVWSRNTDSYDLLIYIANWPEKRRDHWIKLLFARAIENQSYVIGLNRIGTDGNGINYSGDSIIINPKGELLNKVITQKEKIIYATLSKKEIIDYKKSFPVYSDADRFRLI
ncbi:MAG: amidohydrolase [Bacteroidales bacterium]|nr:amidohydrolase [Bacteroidales bacterium]